MCPHIKVPSMGKQEYSGKNTFPIIKCECGLEIALLPDLKEMSLVVHNHAQAHKEAIADPKEAELTYKLIEKSLIAQILRIASRLG